MAVEPIHHSQSKNLRLLQFHSSRRGSARHVRLSGRASGPSPAVRYTANLEGYKLRFAADEVQLAPANELAFRREEFVQRVHDKLGLPEPLLVGLALVIDHGCERIELYRKPACDRHLANSVDEGQKWRQPRFDGAKQTAWFQDAPRVGQGCFQIGR